MEIFHDFKDDKTHSTLRIEPPVRSDDCSDLEDVDDDDDDDEFEVRIESITQRVINHEYWNYIFNTILPAERIEGFTNESAFNNDIDSSTWMETDGELSDEDEDEDEGEIHSDGNIQLNEQRDGEDRLLDGRLDNDATYEVSFPLPCSSSENISSRNSSGKRPRPDDGDDEDLMITNHLKLEPQSKRSRF